MIKYFIDTNILVYAYDISEPDKRARSIQILDRMIVSGTCILSTQVLAEFFVAVTRHIRVPLSKEEARDRIHRFIEVFPILDMTSDTIREACRATIVYPFHYYDAQIWASSHLNGIPVILSEDLGNGVKYGDIEVVNPFLPDFSIEIL